MVDTETTGLFGSPRDLVVDIGISKVDLDSCDVSEVYSAVVNYPSFMVMERSDSWIFHNTDLTVDDVMLGTPFPQVRSEIFNILHGRLVSSFNVAFDFSKFLYRRPWDLRDCWDEAPCIMKSSADVCRIPGCGGGYKWPKLQEAYDFFFPDMSSGPQSHRALSDAMMAGHVLLALYTSGNYPLGVSS